MTDFDAVLKIGGSLSEGPGLGALCQAAGCLAQQRRLLLVPGGGAFADAVRACDARYGLSDTAAHRMALLAMDQYGLLLAELVPGAEAVADLLAARRVAAEGRAAILLPASLLMGADPLPHSWQVTSDSLGAWIAQLVRAKIYVLLKSVDGLDTVTGPQPVHISVWHERTATELASQGLVDEYLPAALAGSSLETWVLNGQQPERLEDLLLRGAAKGTRVCA